MARKLTIVFEEVEDGITNMVHNEGFSPLETLGLMQIVLNHLVNRNMKVQTLKETTGMKIPMKTAGDA